MAAAMAQGNDNNVKIKGLITGRSGEKMTLKTAESPKVVVVLTDDTNIEEPHGAFGMRKKHYTLTSLVPGLAIEVEGTQNEKNQVVAQTIKFSKNSLQTADAIQAGLKPTEAAVATNKQGIEANKQATEVNAQGIQTNQQAIQQNAQQIGVNQAEIQETNQRFNDLSDYEVKAGANVYFAPGSDKISDQDKAALSQLATVAQGLSGYLVQVKGYADSTGNAAMNQQLSLDRSEAVISYLEQTGGIPVIHIVAPGAMGTSNPVASNETAQGREENRRVDVKVLLNKGLNE
jgi:outer membrane protein OmpA-like peptidoglycan-associated protein